MLPKYKRVLLKLSGEALLGKADYGIELGGVVEQILVDPKNPNVLWALVGPRYSGQAPRLYRGGRDGHWEPLDLGAFQPGGE